MVQGNGIRITWPAAANGTSRRRTPHARALQTFHQRPVVAVLRPWATGELFRRFDTMANPLQ